jgi:hypothetical protein
MEGVLTNPGPSETIPTPFSLAAIQSLRAVAGSCTSGTWKRRDFLPWEPRIAYDVPHGGDLMFVTRIKFARTIAGLRKTGREIAADHRRDLQEIKPVVLEAGAGITLQMVEEAVKLTERYQVQVGQLDRSVENLLKIAPPKSPEPVEIDMQDLLKAFNLTERQFRLLALLDADIGGSDSEFHQLMDLPLEEMMETLRERKRKPQ